MELFSESEMASKSPRLLWLDAHGIKTAKRNDLGPDVPPWEAWVGDYDESLQSITNGDWDSTNIFAIGETEEDAIEDLARNRGITLYSTI